MIFKIGQRRLFNADPAGQRLLSPVILLAQQFQVIGQLNGTVYLRGMHRLFLTIVYPPIGINLLLYPTGDNVKVIP